MGKTSLQRADVFKAISDPTRRAILDSLREKPLPVNTLASSFDISRPAISKHLRLLRASSLVEVKQNGRFRFYQLNPNRLEDVELWLNQYRIFWNKKLRSLKTYVESDK
jgi:DNA-binding transcriptional ArsR family regulator